MNLLDMSFSGAVFIIAVVVVRSVLINKISKRTFLVLWEIAFLRLLIPFSIPFMFSIHTLISQVLSHSAFLGTDANTEISAWVQGQIVATSNMQKLSSDILFPHSYGFTFT